MTKVELEKYYGFYIGQKIELNQSRFSENEEDRVFTLSGVSSGKFYIEELQCWYDIEVLYGGSPADYLLLKPYELLTETERSKSNIFGIRDYPGWLTPRMVFSLCEIGVDIFDLIKKGYAKDILKTKDKLDLFKKLQESEKTTESLRIEYNKLND